MIKLNISLKTNGRFCTPYIMAASYARAVPNAHDW